MKYKPTIKYISGVALLAAACFGAGRLSLMIALIEKDTFVSTTPLWLPMGIGIGVLLLYGNRFWPGVWIGQVFTSITTGIAPWLAAIISTGSILAILFPVYILRRNYGFPNSLDAVKKVLSLILFAVIIGPILSATAGVTSLASAGVIPWESYGLTWWVFWMGDAVGTLFIAPLLLVWVTQPSFEQFKGRIIESTVIFVSLPVITWVIYSGKLATGLAETLTYAVFPFIIWSSLRFAQHGALTSIFLFASIATWMTAHDLGPFVRESVAASVMLLQGFISLISVTGILLSAIFLERERAKESLEKNIEILNASQRLTKAGGWEWDIKGQTMNWTDELYHIHGYAPSQIQPGSDKHIQQSVKCYDVDDRPTIMAAFRNCLGNGQPYDLEFPFTTIQGNRKWIRTVSEPILKNGKVTKVLGNVMDITEQKQSEEALRNSESRLKLAMEAANLGIWDWKLSTQEFMGDEHWAGILGYTLDEISAGPNIWQQRVHPENLSRSIATWERFLSGEIELYEDEYRVQHRSGDWLWVAVSGMIVERDQKNNPLRVIGTVQNITKRKLAEEALQDSKFFLDTLLDSIPVPVFYKDTDGRYLGFNKAYEDFFGQTKNELIGKTAFDISPPDLAAIYHAKDQELIKKGGLQEYESKVRNALGDERDVIFFKAVFHDLHGNARGLIGTILDITERQKATREKGILESKLHQSQKMESVGNLAGGIAHDFNNILSSIIGFTELALDDVEKGTNIEDSLQEVYSAGKRAKDLVKQILAFARQSDEEIKPTQVDTIVKEVLQFIRSSIPTTIELKKNLNSDSIIMGNATQIHQIMMNLCTNAAYAMEEGGGTLAVTLEDIVIDKSVSKKLGLLPGNYIELTVSDTGTGIPPDIIASIFDPYFTTKSVGEGTGMGLAMVHGIVETYSGKITVDSRLGQGTSFTIYLPITRKRKEHRPYEPGDLPSGTERILFVDDEASIAKMGSQVLERLGYSVTTRTSSVEALELFRSKSSDFDLVITDMTMPNMTGDKLAVELIKIRPDIPVILCTGYSKKISDETASDIGIKAFAYKPIVKADLAKTVRKVLDEANSGAHA